MDDPAVQVHVTEKRERSQLRLPTDGLDGDVLMIGDSNLKKWKNMSSDWSTHSYPGCTLKEITDMCCRSLESIPDTAYVCLAAGINMKAFTREELMETADSLRRLHEKAGDRLYVVQTLDGEGLEEEHRMAIAQQNKLVRQIVGNDHYIVTNWAKEEGDVVYYNNHYTQRVANCIVAELVDFFA